MTSAPSFMSCRFYTWEFSEENPFASCLLIFKISFPFSFTALSFPFSSLLIISVLVLLIFSQMDSSIATVPSVSYMDVLVARYGF